MIDFMKLKITKNRGTSLTLENVIEIKEYSNTVTFLVKGDAIPVILKRGEFDAFLESEKINAKEKV